MEETFVVICRDDSEYGGPPGPYVLATRAVFHDREIAVAYARGIAHNREAIVVSGDFRHLRF